MFRFVFYLISLILFLGVVFSYWSDFKGNSFTVTSDFDAQEVADYKISGFHYLSIDGDQKDLKITAKTVHVYKKPNQVFADEVHVVLYEGGQDPTTYIDCDHAIYNRNTKILIANGNVKTTLKDGFSFFSSTLEYRPEKRRFFIPSNVAVKGNASLMADQKSFAFSCYGLIYSFETKHLVLSKKAFVTFENRSTQEKTQIQSDYCYMENQLSQAHFEMEKKTPLKERFVKITQDQLFAKARSVIVNYADLSSLFEKISLFDDVFIQEQSASALRYSTSGIAFFSPKEKKIILKQFPQVYQDQDTIAGEIITIHQDTQIVEIEQSNGLSGGGS